MSEGICPRWAKRVSREKILRLYQKDAQGILDEELLDDVAYGLLARAEAITAVTRAHTEGLYPCAACGKNILLKDRSNKDPILRCSCGWEMSRHDYHKSYKRKQLVGGAAQPLIDRAIVPFPGRGTPQEKMRWIDGLIHGFHGELKGEYYRPMAVNFIEGNTRAVVDLIYSLAYSNHSSIQPQKDAWMRKLEQSYVRYRPQMDCHE